MDNRGRPGPSLLAVAAITLFVPLLALVWLVAPLLVVDVPRPTVEAAASRAAEPSVDVGHEPEPILQVVIAEPTRVPRPTAPPTPRPTIAPTATPRVVWLREPAFNFLLIGVDQRVENEIPRTDTIIVGHADMVGNRLALVSIPRDLLVEIPGYGFDRINSAFVYGEQFKERDGGIGLLERTIERNLGVPIHHYAMIDFQCFRTAVDAVGGVTVDVPRTIVDPRYPTDDYGYRLVRFEAGRQRLDGERALEYARTRNADNDFNRIRRQQQILSALRQELLRLGTLPSIPTILGGCRNLRSDLGVLDYVALAASLPRFGERDMTMRAIDETMTVDTYTLGGAAVLMPRWEPIRSLVRDAFSLSTARADPAEPNPRRTAQGR